MPNDVLPTNCHWRQVKFILSLETSWQVHRKTCYENWFEWKENLKEDPFICSMTSCHEEVQVCTKSSMPILANTAGRLHKICVLVVNRTAFKYQPFKCPPWNKTSCRSRSHEELNQEDFHLTKALYRGENYCPSGKLNYKLKVLVFRDVTPCWLFNRFRRNVMLLGDF